MNTVSLVLNGRTAADIALLPERQRSSITTIHARPHLSRSSSYLSSPRGSPRSKPSRPTPSRQISRDSPGWYNTDGGMTLDDFAKRLNTTLSRFEQWQGRCAQNVVMALMRPTPIALLVFNPISVLLYVLLICWWVVGRSGPLPGDG
nr:hypothetical protein CFP56_12262 [Quercus suber]